MGSIKSSLDQTKRVTTLEMEGSCFKDFDTNFS